MMFSVDFKSKLEAVIFALVFTICSGSHAGQWGPTKYLAAYMAEDNIDVNIDMAGIYDPAADLQPQIAAGDGQCLAVWISLQDHGKVVCSHSADGGETWGPSNVSNIASTVTLVGVTYAGNDKWIVVWIEDDLKIFSATLTNQGQTWSSPIQLSAEPLYGYRRTIGLASDQNGHLIAAWPHLPNPDNQTQNVLTVKSADFGQTWTAPEAITDSNNLYPIKAVRGVTYSNGRWTLLYQLTTSNIASYVHTFAATSVDNGSVWTISDPIFISERTNGHPDYEAAICAIGNTIATASWARTYTQYNGTDYHLPSLVVSTSSDGGRTYGDPITLTIENQSFYDISSKAPYHRNIAIGSDGAGNWLLAADSLSTPTLGKIKVWRSTDPGSTWTQTKIFNTDETSTFYPSLVSPSAQTFVAAFEHKDPKVFVTDRDFDIQSARTTDGGVTWTTSTYLNDYGAIDIGTSNDEGVGIAASDNLMIAAWIATDQFPQARSFDLMIARSTDNGNSWSGPETLTFDKMVEFRKPYVLFSGGQSWLIYWRLDDQWYSITSRDNGLSWSPIMKLSAPNAYINYKYPFHIKNTADFIASDNAGRIVKGALDGIEYSDDGGLTWTSSDSTDVDVDYIAHSSHSNWLVLGDDGEILQSNNGGVTWKPGNETNLNSFSVKQIASNHEGLLLAIGTADQPSPAGSLKINTLVSRSYDNGESWSFPETVNSVTESTAGAWYGANLELYPRAIWSADSYWKLFIRTQLDYTALNVFRGQLFTSDSLDSISWSDEVEIKSDSDDSIDSLNWYSPVEYATSDGYLVAIWSTGRGLEQVDSDVAYRLMHPGRITAAADWALFD